MQFPFLHIIRIPNLLIVALTQVLVYARCLNLKYLESVMSWADLAMLSLITMLVAAAGYVINDYFDVKVDQINKPARMIADRTIPLPTIKLWYSIILIIGGFLSVWLAVRLRLLGFWWTYPLTCLCLLLYSAFLKCKPLIGNIWVALFCGGVVGVVALPDLIIGHHSIIKATLLPFILFATLSNLFREIVKDLEDEEGDRAGGCQTFVVRYGKRPGEIAACFAGACLIAAMFFWHTMLPDAPAKLVLFILELSVAALMGYIWKAKKKNVYRFASLGIKLIMVAGTGILLLI